MNKKEKINVVVGIVDIIGAIIYFFVFYLAENQATNNDLYGVTVRDIISFIALFWAQFAKVGIILHIFLFFKRKTISMIGNIFGLIGHGLCILVLFVPQNNWFFLLAAILCIVSTFYVLKKK